MRRLTLSLAAAFIAAGSLFAAPPAAQPEPTGMPSATVPPAAADQGKDVVHQLNNAFMKVFEVVAPSVVVIETTKNRDESDTPSLEDLLFQNQPDQSPRRSPRNQPAQS